MALPVPPARALAAPADHSAGGLASLWALFRQIWSLWIGGRRAGVPALIARLEMRLAAMLGRMAARRAGLAPGALGGIRLVFDGRDYHAVPVGDLAPAGAARASYPAPLPIDHSGWIFRLAAQVPGLEHPGWRRTVLRAVAAELRAAILRRRRRPGIGLRRMVRGLLWRNRRRIGARIAARTLPQAHDARPAPAVRGPPGCSLPSAQSKRALCRSRPPAKAPAHGRAAPFASPLLFPD